LILGLILPTSALLVTFTAIKVEIRLTSLRATERHSKEEIGKGLSIGEM
jgi:hypothetical protein